MDDGKKVGSWEEDNILFCWHTREVERIKHFIYRGSDGIYGYNLCSCGILHLYKMYREIDDKAVMNKRAQISV